MYERYLEFAKDVARQAGRIMLKYFDTEKGERYKADRSIVTLADTDINRYLIERVKQEFPGHSVDGEEEQFGHSSMVWVCDPVDGTALYARHIPTAVFSLALVEDGRSVAGIIYDPFTDTMYSAALGQGAYKNGERMHVSSYALEDRASVSNYDMWAGAPFDIHALVTELGKKTYFLSLGSVIRACACVASGEFTMAVFPGTTHKNCDIAAAKVIVEEAGGKVTDMFGNEQRYDGSINGAIVSNGVVHDEVVGLTRRLFGYEG